MPRRARLIVPNTPHHIVQRGHNRNAVFVEPADFRYYLGNLKEWKRRLGVRVYSFCLMTNHVHLVLEPGAETSSISRLMKQLAARQTRWVNKQEGRSGTLWEGRYKCSPIQREGYLMRCCRYVERNPVAAKLVSDPGQYPWSSFPARAGATRVGWLDHYESYLALGSVTPERQARYQAFVGQAPSDAEAGLIRQALARNQLTGQAAFVDEIERRLGLRIEHRSRGRPRK